MSEAQLLPKLIAVDGEEISLKNVVTVVGRMPECTLQIDDENVSRRHAELNFSGTQVTVCDLGSRNATWVNDQKIESPTVLQDGDRLRFGDVSFVFRSVEGQQREQSAETVVMERFVKPTSPASADSTATWQIRAPLTLVRSDGVEYGINQTLTLGRDPSNDISYPKDRGLSQFHARFDLTEGGLFVVDLKSRNGTWVNGKRISTPMLLKHGDRVRSGGAVFRLRVGERPLPALPTEKAASRRGCMGFGFLFSGLTALIGIGAILFALLIFGAVVIWPNYFAPTPYPTSASMPTTESTPIVFGVEATQQVVAERQALRALVWVIVPVGSPDDPDDYSTGSGSLVSEDGYVLTNFHVIGDVDDGDYYNEDSWVGIGLNWDNPSAQPDTFYRAEVIKADRKYDLALVHITAGIEDDDLPGKLNAKSGDVSADAKFPFIPIGNSDALEIGASLAVIGFPGLGGLTPTFTRGTVSGFLYDEVLDLERGWIKTDAEINPGNSGGMAINARGELIGVPTMVYYGTQVVGKISEIRPINLAQEFLDEIP